MEVECDNMYAEIMGIWMQQTRYVEMQEIGKKIHVAEDKTYKFEAIMSTLPPAKVVKKMAENMKLY
jgi:phospholipid N-methyltransferase